MRQAQPVPVPVPVIDAERRQLECDALMDAATEARHDDGAHVDAIRAGARSAAHPRTEVAEVLLRAGRRAEADAVFADLRRRCPDDVWLRNAAGFCYSHANDPAEALVWLDEGLVMAMEAGDPEGTVEQLADTSKRKPRGAS